MKPGDYVAVKVLRAAGTTMYCEALGLTTLTEFYSKISPMRNTAA